MNTLLPFRITMLLSVLVLVRLHAVHPLVTVGRYW